MKKYNKPVVEIKGFEVEDIIAQSIYFQGDSELQAVYKNFAGEGANPNDQAVVFEW